MKIARVRFLQLTALIVAVVLSGCGTSNDQVARYIQIVERRVQASNGRDFATWQGLHATTAVRTAPELEQPLQGAAAMRVAIEELVASFPNYKLEIRNSFGERDQLLVEMRATGTQTGELVLGGKPVPPTGKSFVSDSTFVFRFSGEQITEVHEYYDQLSIGLQLGIIALP